MTTKRVGIPAAAILASGVHSAPRGERPGVDPDDQIVEIRATMGLELVLGRTDGQRVGTYEWQDGHGRVWCSGSVCGSIYATKCEAVQHLRGELVNARVEDRIED